MTLTNTNVVQVSGTPQDPRTAAHTGPWPATARGEGPALDEVDTPVRPLFRRRFRREWQKSNMIHIMISGPGAQWACASLRRRTGARHGPRIGLGAFRRGGAAAGPLGSRARSRTCPTVTGCARRGTCGRVGLARSRGQQPRCRMSPPPGIVPGFLAAADCDASAAFAILDETRPIPRREAACGSDHRGAGIRCTHQTERCSPGLSCAVYCC